jgi:hypothetical protein
MPTPAQLFPPLQVINNDMGNTVNRLPDPLAPFRPVMDKFNSLTARNGKASQCKAPAAKPFSGSFTAGCYRIVTGGGPNNGHQPKGWGLSSWNAHGAKRNGGSSWAAVHSGNYWPMDWRIQPSTRTAGTWTIKTGKHHHAGRQPKDWGLSSWNAHGAKRNGGSSRVATHSGNYWLMDWAIQPSTRTAGTFTIKTAGGPSSGHQPKGWGLAAWGAYGGRRGSTSSWVYTHAGNHYLMDWKLEKSNGCN